MSATPNLGLTKIALGDTSWKADEDTNKDTLDALFDATTGHTHDGTAGDGPNLPQASVANLTTDLAGKQPLDADLTAIAGLSPANDDVLQRKAGAWTNRTLAQLAADISAVAAWTEAVQDVIGAMVAAAGGTYDDAGNAITLPSGGGTYTAGAGLSLSGGAFAVDISGQTEDTSADPANDFLLSYDASASALKKVKPNNLGISAGSTGALIPLHDETLASDTTTLTYSPPSSGYRDLIIRVEGRTDEAVGHSALKVQVSADTGANYGDVLGDTQYSGSGFGAVYNVLGETGVAYVRGGYIPGTSGPTNARGSLEIVIPDYLNTSSHKQMRISGSSRAGSATTDMLYFWREGWWQSTSAVSQVDINIVTGSKKFKAGTRFTVWGVKAS